MSAGDPRVAGFYEQALGWNERIDLTRSLATVVGSLAGLETRGLLDRPGRVSFAELRSLAGSDRISDYDARTIPLASLLCHVRVAVTADVMVWDTLEHGPVRLGIDAALRDDSAQLVLGSDRAEGASGREHTSWTAPIVLHSGEFSTAHSVSVTRLTVTTWSEIEGGAP